LVRRTFFPVGDHAEAHADGSTASALLPGPAPSRRDAALRVLVVDPVPASTRASGLASATVASLTRRVGAMPTVSKARTPEAVLLDHFVAEPDVALVVVHDEVPSAHDVRDPWWLAAAMTKVLRDTGTPVLAVGFGASPMAVSACVERGAIGVFDIEEVPEELVRLVRAESDERALLDTPAPYRGLVELTPAERRVLYQMMRGRSGAEIAGEHAVSLSTVRTHIRSILRKLNVNSQLAAVAVANGFPPPQSAGA
jgi:DNA-binding CsgD family transcriptional regulator